MNTVDCEESLHKKPRMDDEKDIAEDVEPVEPIKVVSDP